MSSEESIYNWIVPEPVRPEKPPMYRSQHSSKAPLAGSTLRVGTHNKFGHATMGAELKGSVRADAFLKAHEKSGVTPAPGELRA